MKYPSIYLVGERAHGEILSVAFAGPGQNQDTGGKVFHAAPRTTSEITSKSISAGGGIASYRGMLEVAPGAIGARSRVVCDALLLDERAVSNTWPTIRIGEQDSDVGHEASTSKLGEEQLFYLRSRGLDEAEARALIVNGFIEPIVRQMPFEYAVEINRLLELQMEGSIG
jgi:Fe-S cluster assembly protein SufB